jgi:hypothetical protein
MLSSLHHIAEQIERHNWSRIIHAPYDAKQVEEHKKIVDKLWKEVEVWKQTLEEQAEIAKKGNGWERDKLTLS